MSTIAPTPTARVTPRIQARPQPTSNPSSSSSTKPIASSSKPLVSRPTAIRQVSSKPPTVVSTKPKPTPSTTSFLVPGKDTSSSSGKVFAKPSKEWVLPERAKPGRKVAIEEPDDTRQSQNRQSQRAHRARRTDYITTLEERIRQFEADEIHSNVRLQEVARALKADNERLKAELLARSTTPREVIPKAWEEERRVLITEIKTLREEVRRYQGEGGSGGYTITPTQPSSASPEYLPSNQRGEIGGIRHIADCPICPNPDPDCPCQKTTGAITSRSYNPHQSNQINTYNPNPNILLGSTAERVTCGFCQSTEECLCRMIDDDEGEEEDVKPIILTPPIGSLGLEEGGCGLCADGGFCACAVARISPRLVQSSLQQESAAAAAAVPLRKLRSGDRGQGKKSIWALEGGVVPAGSGSGLKPTQRVGEAVCSGDPSNCDACRNDTFGQEFCSNFFSKDPSGACTKCKGKCSSSRPSTSAPPPPPLPSSPQLGEGGGGPLLMACCGDAGLCGHQCTGTVIGIGGLIPGLPEKDIPRETIRVDQAWKQLKAHPNSKFASLAFLADVVAQRATAVAAEGSKVEEEDGLGFAESQERGGERMKEGGKRKMVVESRAVADALRVLDGTPVPGEGEDSELRLRKRVRLD